MGKKKPTSTAIMDAAKGLKRPLEAEQADLLANYLDQLIKWNKKMNLVGPSDWRTIMDTLVVDSLYLADFLSDLNLPDAPLALDLGAGAGLPGIPLRCLWQEGDYTLVEIREKRAMFMRSVVGRMKLAKTFVFHGRAENAVAHLEETGRGEGADLVLSRAFMPWEKLLEFVRPMLRASSAGNGLVVILSNDPAPTADEMPDGWKLVDTAHYKAAGKTRHFWCVAPA